MTSLGLAACRLLLTVVLGGAAAAAVPTYNIQADCGAVGDNSTVNTAAIQACLDRAGAAGGVALVPRGVFLTGTVSIASHVTLMFADGGWLQGSWHTADYSSDWDYWHVVQAVNVTDVSILGAGPGTGGVVGALWQMVARYDATQRMLVPRPWSGVHGCAGECRPKNLALVDVARATLANFSLVDSSSWTTLLRRVSDVALADMSITGPLDWPNGDGVDVESGRNVSFTRLRIATGDDAVALRSGNCNDLRTPWPRGPIAPLVGVRITNCTLTSTSAAVSCARRGAWGVGVA